MPTISDAVREATRRLAAAGPGRAEAEWLLASMLGLRHRHQLLTAPPLSDEQAMRYGELLDQRLQGIPLQHLLGSAPFRHLDLKVGPGVFIPRPETELIIDIATTQLRAASCVVDLCAGSGALAIAVATEFSVGEVIAVERSEAALPWLRTNVGAFSPRVRIVVGDVTDHRLTASGGALADVQADVVVSNPPYVPASRRGAVSAEVRHDPEDAVFGGPDGLSAIHAVLRLAAGLLRAGGLLVMEHDDSHQLAVLELLASSRAWTGVQAHPDLAGLPRFVSAVRQDEAHGRILR